MWLEKSIVRKLAVSLVTVLATAVASMAADVRPLVFAGISNDQTIQQKYWDNLMRYKMFGTDGIKFNCGNIKVPDKSGWFGTSKGDFILKNQEHVVGGPIVIGGDIVFDDGKDSFTSGPTRVGGSVTTSNFNSPNTFEGSTCVRNDVAQKFRDAVPASNLFNFNTCPDSVPQITPDLVIPDFNYNTYTANEERGALSANNETVYIDIPAGKGMYDIKIPSINLVNVSKLYIRMPKGGRLTRIFVKDALSISAQSIIQIQYLNDEGGYTTVPNEEYAGNLLFYVTADFTWAARTNDKPLQGTYISSGTINVLQQLTLAGQLLAKYLIIDANFDGSGFHYVPFDPPSFSAKSWGQVYEGADYVGKKQPLTVTLNKTPETAVSFKYCFVFKGEKTADVSVGNDLASEDDMVVSEMPLCKNDAWGRASFSAGDSTLKDTIFVKVANDNYIENDEKFQIVIDSLEGAVASDSNTTRRDTFDITIIDDDKVPVCHDTTIVGLEDQVIQFTQGKFNEFPAFATDDTTPLDSFGVAIIERSHNPFTVWGQIVDLTRPISSSEHMGHTQYTPGLNEYGEEGKHYDSLTFAVEFNTGVRSNPCKMYFDIDPVNDKPVLDDVTITIRENTPVDSVLLQLVATDVENDKLTYAIDSGDVALFTLKGAVKDSLVLKGALDYETQKVHVLKVVVTDDGEGNLKDTAYVTIKLIDENETPKFDKSSYEFTVREHAPYDSIFGTIHATDPDANSEQASFKELSYTYKLITPTKDNSAFKLFEKEGNFAVLNSDSLNYESFDKYELWAYATDAEDLKDSAKVIINVTDINEEPAFEKEPLYYQANFVEVPEITTNHDLLTFNFSDPDIKSLWATNGFHKLNLELLECTLDACQLGNEKEIDTDVNTLFAIKMNSDSTSGVLSLKGASSLDYEKDSTYNMMVRVYDNKGSAPSYADTIVIRVRITNVNEKPKFDSTKYTFSVKEHQVDIVELGKVHASDPDSNTTLKYSFANGALTDASGKFSIDASTGLIATTESLDYETQDSYSMKVYVTDNDVDNPLQDSVPVTINVIDINETPWADAITCKIKETAAKNTAPNLNGSTTEKCVVKGQDPDIKNINFNQLTYTWADATEKGADIFAINATTGAVTLVKENVLDYDAGDRSYTLTVKIADNGGLDSTTTVLINIENVNEPPFLDDVTISIPENTETAVAIYTLVATDPEPGALDFEITSITPEEDFEVVPLGNKKGVLVVVDDLDHETKPTYTLKVKVTDAGDLSYVATVTIIVTDVNEPPYFKKKVNTFHVKEHNDADAYVGQVYGYDDDKDERYNQLTYSLASDPSGLFAVSKDGVITVPKENVLNFESLAEDFMYQLKVKVSDGYLDAMTTVYVIVDDVNEKPELNDTTFSVKEHASSGTVVGKVVATDKDKGQTLSYQLLTTSAEFTVSTEGKITTRKNLNFETKQQYTIDVLVTDDGENLPNDSNLTDTATITINIIDINEKPVVGDQSFTILETAEYPEIVGTFKNASDKDVLNDYFSDLSFFISDSVVDGVVTNATDFFTINESTGKISVKEGATFDYETKSKVYYLKLTVRDHVDPNKDDSALEAYALVTINIENVPEPPKFDPKFRDYDVDENSPKGTVVGELAAIDNDEDETLVYTLKNPDGSESKEFQVFYDDDKATIKVRENANLDYETKAEYKVIVIVTDKTNLEDTAYVTITINDVNENPTMEEQFFELYENSGADFKLDGTIQSGDLDTAAIFTKNTYVAVGGDTALFTINGRGEIFANYDMDYEEYKAKNKTTFIVKVKVVDKGDETLYTVQNIYIDLLNVNEQPEVLTDTLYAAEDALAGTEIGMLDAKDPDGPTTFTYTLIRASKQFNVSPDGIVTVKTDNILDYETKDHAYTIYVNVQDAEGLASDTKPVVIIVSDVNEPPTLNDTTIYVREDASVDTLFAKLIGSDPDIYTEAFSQLSYELISTKDTFDVLSDGSVKLLRRLDYEADSVYERKVRVTDGTFYDTANVIIKVINVIESTVVEIVKVEDPDSLWEYPDTVYTNIPEKNVTWLREDKVFSFDTTLREGPNVIKRCYWNRTKDYEGCDSVIIYYSNATPVVKIYSDPADISADNVYTIVEDVDKSDTNYYVNTTDKKITVSVTDTAAGVKKKFDVNLELDTVGVPEKTLKTVNEITKEKVTLRDGSDVEVVKTPVNGEKIVVSYKDTVEIDGEPVLLTVSYDTDTKGNETKVAVINEKGKVDSIQVITVSYTTKVNGKEMVISYKADAITGEVLNTTAGGQLTKADNSNDVATAESAVGTFSVSYNYVDKGNAVTVHYVVDEDGDIVTNEDGDIGYSVSYSYTNKFGNTATKSLYIVLDRVGPKVEILDPVKNDKKYEVVNSNFITVKWTVNGEEQDTLTTQGLEKGLNAIVRFYRDKAGNEASDTVFIIMKNSKTIEIAIEQPVTEITRDKVEEYYAKNEPIEGQTYAVSVMNPTTGVEVETQKGGKDLSKKESKGSGEAPYPGLDGHLGPTLSLDIKLPVVRQTNENAEMDGMSTGIIGGLATFDDIVNAEGLISLDGVDANNGEKLTVDEYVKEYCVDGFNPGSDLTQANLYDSKASVKIWVYTTTGEFVNYYNFTQKLNDPSYTNEAGMLKLFFEMKPDENGDVRNDAGRLIGTGSYIYKVEVKLRSELKCSLPPVMDASSPKKGDIVRNDEQLLKSFGYKRPAQK